MNLIHSLSQRGKKLVRRLSFSSQDADGTEHLLCDEATHAARRSFEDYRDMDVDLDMPPPPPYSVYPPATEPAASVAPTTVARTTRPSPSIETDDPMDSVLEYCRMFRQDSGGVGSANANHRHIPSSSEVAQLLRRREMQEAGGDPYSTAAIMHWLL